MRSLYSTKFKPYFIATNITIIRMSLKKIIQWRIPDTFSASATKKAITLTFFHSLFRTILETLPGEIKK